MIGAMTGDIVGSVYEWNNNKTKDFGLFDPKCRFTDDSVMTAAVGLACLEYAENKDLAAFEQSVIKNMHALGRAYINAGYGRNFTSWLLSDDPQPYNSYGNGSAMRVSPVAYAAESLEEAETLAEISARVSHNHPEGIKGAKAAASAVFMALHGRSKQEIRNYIAANYYDLDFTLDEIRADYDFDVSCQGSVPQALEAFLESESFEDAIRNAISIGGDSDTIACITGSIAEAYFDVPEEIKSSALKVIAGTMLEDTYKRFNAVFPKA